MHGFSSGSTFLVNAEVDSMGGVVDGGVGVGNKPSPRRAAIEKAQAELRLEYDVREERRRELEFLEKGGNPLDFKFGHAASVSVQSTSHTYQHPDQILTSEAKGSLTASPHGDSVESSGRLGITTACEPNSADNFDGENEILESERKSKHPTRGSITPSEHSSQLDRSQNVKESEDSPIFHPKKGQAYRRRNRSRTNRDGPRSSSSDMASRGGQNSALPGRHAILSKTVASENKVEIGSDGTEGMHLSATSKASALSDGKLNVSTLKEKQEELKNLSVKADEVPDATITVEPDKVAEKENVVIVDVEGPPCSSTERKNDIAGARQLDESDKINRDGKSTPNDAFISNATVVTKGLDSESSCVHTSLSVDGNGNIQSDLYANLKNVDSNGAPKEQKLPLGEKSISVDDEMANEKHVTNPVEIASCVKEDQKSVSHQGNGFANQDRDVDGNRCSSTDKPESSINIEETGPHEQAELKSDKEHGLPDDSNPKEEGSVRPLSSAEPPSLEVSKNELSVPPPASKLQTSSEIQQKQFDKAHEDRVLEEARIVEAKRKRIAELSVGLTLKEHRRKSHWEFVLEEMAWLANDFAQERVWKVTAAAQICHRAAFASRLRLEEQNKCLKQRSVAHTLAKAVMEFWHSASLLVENFPCSRPEKSKLDASSGEDETGLVKEKSGGHDKDKVFEENLQSTGRKQDLAVYGYAVRFLQHNCSLPNLKVEGSGTPDVVCDIDSMEVLWQDQLTEENLFYLVPPGALETYRKSIDSCLAEFERASNNVQEEVDTSIYDAAAEIGFQENDYEEDEGENMYYLPGAFDTGRPSKKKRKIMKSYAARPYELGNDFGYGRCLDNRNGTPQSALMGKRTANNLHVGSIPTKRMRTASRQRVVGPFGAGSAGVAPAPCRTDASSGDTNSFQDDQSTLHGGSIALRGSEVDSAMDFEKQSTFESAEFSAKPKKKKKIKHPGSGYDPRWQVDSSALNEQKDHLRKRLDSHQLESNGNSGLFAQHAKKPKILKQSLDNSFDNVMPMSGSVASPVASQMSNMSSQSKIIKLIGGRDRNRKAKGLKVPTVQPGSGSPWSSFEDQALIVLVHDMGPNWELVSDAINSTLRFKCIFRKPQECRERHKTLMDRTPGDGADSAEDSGSSQPYPSTLPGIPKGSARQLFQQLQRPMEEDTIKSHFEKIILIGQQFHFRKKQNDHQDTKQLAPVHGSHIAALSQVIPNNVNGMILTPLDLCDTPNQDAMSLGFQGSHTGGSLPNQGASPSMHPPGGPNSSIPGLPGSPSMGISNNLASQSSQFANSRDARYPVPRSTSLPIEEQQRLQQYNHMLPGRNAHPSNLPSGSLSGTDRGVRILPGGNSVGMVAGMSRSMARPGLQGVPSSSMLNSGSMLSPGMPSNMNMHSGTASGQGNSMFRPRDALHMVRPGQNSEHQRQMMLPESSSSAVAPFGALSSGFSNQTTSPPLQTYAGHHHQQHPVPPQHSHVLGGPHHPHHPGSNHSVTPEQQAFLRLARDRQIQQRLLQRQHQQQQQQLPASSALMTHTQTPSQLPVSSTMQSASQLQSPSSSQPVSLPPLTPSSPITHVSSQSSQSQKHQVPPQGIGRNAQTGASGLMNQGVKPRQRQAQQLQQQYQQSGRQHPQQRQQSQPQQQAKLVKGMGRNNMLTHQNVPVDPSHLNGLTANPENQVAEKGEQAVHLMQSQGLYSGSSLNTMQSSKPLPAPQSSSHLQHQKQYVNAVPATPKQVQQMPSHLDSSNQGHVPAVSSASASGSSTQSLPATVLPSLKHQQLQGQSQPPHKVVNQSQPALQRAIQQNRQVNSDQAQPALQRAVQQNRQVNSDPLIKSQPDHAPVEKQCVNNTSMNPRVQPVCVDSPSALPLPASASADPRKQARECDSTATNASTPSGPISSPALANSSGNETLPSVSDGLGQRQLSGNLAAHGHGVQSQHQQPQLHPPPIQPILPQKQSQQQLEKSPQRVPQPQPQSQIQAGQSNVFARTPNSRLE